MKKISTTQLSKRLGLSLKEGRAKLTEEGMMRKVDDVWQLTEQGKENGGEYKETSQYGQYIIWPESWAKDNEAGDSSKNEENTLITATDIGKFFDVSRNKINYVLSELGWLKKGDVAGWVLTEQGKKIGGAQTEHHTSGVPFVRWPETITKIQSLVETVAQLKGKASEKRKAEGGEEGGAGFREKFPATHRAVDGHVVRSKAEMIIDNWLYMSEIVHAYERKLPIEEDVYCDFYIPTGKVYIEYWGFENNPKYLERKQKKLELYKKYEFKLIELEDKDVKNLDDILPKQLLPYGVKAY
jgi:Mn-dependent DtxR family transcriptional regulator